MIWFGFPPCPPGRRPPDPPAQPMTVELEFKHGMATVMISGELDLITMPLLSERLSLILRQKPQQLILDMARTSFLDCGSARLIVGAGHLLPGGRLVIRHPSRAVRRILELTGLDADCQIEE